MAVIEKSFRVNTKKRSEFVDITADVERLVKGSGVSDGDVIVYCTHTTAAITINENADPTVVDDVLLTLEELIPKNRQGYRHGEGNSDAHVKSSMFGCSEQVLIKDGFLVLGTWQGLYFCEFDGPRSRNILVHIRSN
jgi:secondary thiamine-phosphate synthase enzyme